MKRMTLNLATVLVGSIFLASSSVAMAWGDCDEKRSLEKDIEIGDLLRIQVEAGAGKLEIEGVSDENSVSIRADLCASDKELLEEMDVQTKLDGGSAMIRTHFPKKSWGNYAAAIDLYLTVPVGASLKVSDSSGDLRIENVAELELTDSSGDVNLQNIPGHIKLTDSSGSIRIQNVGSAEVTDSSGDMIAQEVKGDFTVEVDSSGDIRVKDVDGSFLVRVDSSGSISADNIKGDFVVEKDGSGNIDYDSVGGNVTIPARKQK